ncbi:hypothetical protein [Burkholderia gladioli]|uniref:hypothetical protein n=1 Tax=Burkholderia gladioli TaxID=28095 RepID=UPI0016419355|nr:hypothetical protein [Burkholderia gladioli]
MYRSWNEYRSARQAEKNKSERETEWSTRGPAIRVPSDKFENHREIQVLNGNRAEPEQGGSVFSLARAVFYFFLARLDPIITIHKPTFLVWNKTQLI